MKSLMFMSEQNCIEQERGPNYVLLKISLYLHKTTKVLS